MTFIKSSETRPEVLDELGWHVQATENRLPVRASGMRHLLALTTMVTIGLVACVNTETRVDIDATVEARLAVEREIGAQVEATVQAMLSVTATSQPTSAARLSPTSISVASPLPTHTSTPLPRSTPTATPSSTPTPLPVPSPTFTPSPTPTPLPAPTPTARPSPTPTQLLSSPTLAQVIDLVRPSVVQIFAGDGSGSGSGFFISGEWIVTNAHVVGYSNRVIVIKDETHRLDGTVVGRSEAFDLAVVRLDSPVSVRGLELADSGEVEVGEEVAALGFPPTALGPTSGTVSRGIVSAKQEHGGARLLQTDAAINPGSSGGPLINRIGTVIGVSTSRTEKIGDRPAENIGYAIASNTVRDYLPALMEGWYELSQTIHIEAGEFEEVGLHAMANAKVSYGFTVGDPATVDIGFRVFGPGGDLLAGSARLPRGEGTLVASIAGFYTLEFDNSYSIFTPKTVTIWYQIAPPSRR